MGGWGGWGGVGWFFSDYRVSPNFLLCWGWVVVEVGLGCDNKITKQAGAEQGRAQTGLS